MVSVQMYFSSLKWKVFHSGGGSVSISDAAQLKVENLLEVSVRSLDELSVCVGELWLSVRKRVLYFLTLWSFCEASQK